MAKKKLKVLGVHGLGDHRNSTWKKDWQDALESSFPGQDQVELEFAFLTYDPVFEQVDISPWEAMRAVWRLSKSGVATALGRRRGVVSEVTDRIRWTAGYVVAWLEDEEFKRKTRELVLEAIATEQPDVVLAHSLGSLVTYNAFTHPDAQTEELTRALKQLHYVTLGSQLGNPFVVGTLAGGRLDALPVKQWYHLYNREDDVFTAPIRLGDAPNFRQLETSFDIAGFADHSAEEYLLHPDTIQNVWRPIAERRINAKAFGSTTPRARTVAAPSRSRPPRRRALLVGINEYPNADDRLEGCVNDVFTMSSVLQECGFEPGSIRVCLDSRATASGILERLEWLLDDPQPKDELVFYYSGHGARIPQYGEDFEPDRHTESLVPWNFDWSEETAIIDDQIFGLYSQLPYETRFAMILDCCHSGGLHRQGGAKVRGLNPPDDIRHRELKWDAKTGMWVQRDFARLNDEFSSKADVNQQFFGADGASTRIGRASLVRMQSETEYQKAKGSRRKAKNRSTSKSKKQGKSVGPYLPLIIEACGEAEFSYEYRHGVTSHGAFTYALAKILRERKRISFRDLVGATGELLRELQYQQRPQILGPASILQTLVPWTAG